MDQVIQSTESPVNVQPSTQEATQAPTEAAPALPADDTAALLKLAKEVFDGPDATQVGAESATNAEEPGAVSAENAEPKPTEVKKAVDEKTAERIARAHRAEERVKKQMDLTREARAALASEREQLEQAKAKVSADLARLERLKTADAATFFKEIGRDPTEFIREVATSEDVVNPLAVQVRELEARVRESEAHKQRAEEDRLRTEYSARIHAAEVGFGGWLNSNIDKFPTLAKEFTPQEATRRGIQLFLENQQAFRRQFGRPIDDADVAEYLEAEAEQRAASRTWGHGSAASQNQQVSQSTRSATSDTAAVAHTLTNAGASTASVAKRERTQEEIDEECVRLLAAAYNG